MESNVSLKTVEPFLLQQDPVVAVCGADNNYAMPLAVTIRSAVENFNSDRKFIWFVIDGGITPRNKCRIRPASDWYFRYLKMTDCSRYNHTAPQRLWRRIKREVKALQSKFHL